MSEVEKIFKNHSFVVDGTWYCSFDSVYEDLLALGYDSEEIGALMEEAA
jgi:hypothetical protein